MLLGGVHLVHVGPHGQHLYFRVFGLNHSALKPGMDGVRWGAFPDIRSHTLTALSRSELSFS